MTKRLSLGGLGLLAAALVGGCAGYANVPGPVNVLSGKNPNARNPVRVVGEALRWTANKFPVDGQYSVELPVGTSKESAQKILAGMPSGAEQFGWSDRGLPSFHVGRTWIRSGLAKVDIYRPVVDTRMSDGRMGFQRIVVWMEGGLEPWHVVRSQRGPIGVLPRMTESFAPPGLIDGQGNQDRTMGTEPEDVAGGTIYSRVPGQRQRRSEPQPDADYSSFDHGQMQPMDGADAYMPPSDVPMTVPQPRVDDPWVNSSPPADPGGGTAPTPTPTPTPEPASDGMILIEPLSGGAYTAPAQQDAGFSQNWQPSATAASVPINEPNSGNWVHVTTSEPTGTASFTPLAPTTTPSHQQAPPPTGDGVVVIESLDPSAPLQGTKPNWADSAEMSEAVEYHPMPAGGEGVAPSYDPFAVQGQPEVIETVPANAPDAPEKQVQDSIIIEPTK